MDFGPLEAAVERARADLEEAYRIYDKTNIEARQIKLLRKAETALQTAERELRIARERRQRVVDKEERELHRLAEREPPSLQQLLLDHAIYDETGKAIGAWELVPKEAWAKFNADMEEWKWKIREGKFPPKIW